MWRFELENFRNVILFDDFILISNTFYQSVDHFKFRTKNSSEDLLKKNLDIIEVEYHSIGNILTLKFDDRNLKFKFSSNKRMKEFLNVLQMNHWELVSSKRLNIKSSLVSILFPIVVLTLIISIVCVKYGLDGFIKYFILFIGFFIAMTLIFKKHFHSSIVKYKKINGTGNP